jgi:hypothetical protein
MAVSWGEYEPFDPEISGLPSAIPRVEALAAYRRLMELKGERIQALRQLLLRNGRQITPTDDGLQALNDWFDAALELAVRSPDDLEAVWFSVINDIGLYLGDAMIERAPGLAWEFYTRSRRSPSYQRHVIAGFSRVPNRSYCVDVDLQLATHARRLAQGLPEDPASFVSWVHAAVDKA